MPARGAVTPETPSLTSDAGYGALDVLGLLAELAHHGLVARVEEVTELEDVLAMRRQYLVDNSHMFVA